MLSLQLTSSVSTIIEFSDAVNYLTSAKVVL